MDLAISYHWRITRVLLFFFMCSFLISFFICLYYHNELLFFLSKPFLLLQKRLIFTHISTGFWVSLMTAFWFTVLVETPFFVYCILLFFSKAVYRYKLYFYSLFLLVTMFLLWCLFFVLYSWVLPLFLSFFLSFENPSTVLRVALEARLDQYLTFLTLLLIFLIGWMLIPLVLLSLRIYTRDRLSWLFLRKICYTLLLSFFLLIAPPDLFLQCIMSVPLVFLLEMIFFIFYIIEAFLKYLTEESRIRTYDEH